jgi:hypothetical protein
MKPHLKMAYIITYETTPEDGLYYYIIIIIIILLYY